MATHSRILAWRIPRTEEPGRLQSVGSQRVGHNWTTANRNIMVGLQCCINFSCIVKWLSYTDIYIPFYILFYLLYPRRLNIVPRAAQMPLFIIHPIYNGLHLLTLNSQSVPPLFPSHLAATSLFSMTVNLFLFCRSISLCHILPSTYKRYHMVCFSLSDLYEMDFERWGGF